MASARARFVYVAVTALAAILLTPAAAQSPTAPARAAASAESTPGRSVAASAAATEVKPFSGVLQRIFETGVIRLGHRQNSPPFAFIDPKGQPVGYSLDLCAVIVEQVASHLHRAVDTRLVPVTPADRFDKVRAGEIDLECGSSTANEERRAMVAFSPTIFVTGTKLLVRRGAGIRSIRDLRGRRVALTRGTVHEKAVPALAARQKLPIEFVFTNDHDESFAAVVSGLADAFANDDVQLYGMLAARDAAGDFRVVGDFLTYADYAITLPRDDPEFAAVVGEAFDGLSGSGEIRAIYRKWFQQPLPSGERLDIPMSPHLEHVFGLQMPSAD
jgi:glutamate/aspartate transport system substrate-binding protein